MPFLRASLLPRCLQAVLASLEQQQDLVSPMSTLQSICPTSAVLGSRVPTTHMRARCYNACRDFPVSLFAAFPLAWQVRAGGRWCLAELCAFSCCPRLMLQCAPSPDAHLVHVSCCCPCQRGDVVTKRPRGDQCLLLALKARDAWSGACLQIN